MQIIVETRVNAPLDVVWHAFTTPAEIRGWAAASDGWHVPRAEGDLREGGRFLTRMEARDGSAGFDFEGTYSVIETGRVLEQTLSDGRRIRAEFIDEPRQIIVRETFDADPATPIHLQRAGWQAILDSFKRHVETVADDAAR